RIEDDFEDRARQHLRKAAKLSGSAGPLFDLYTLEKQKNEGQREGLPSAAIADLRAAVERDPKNLVLATEWLLLQAACCSAETGKVAEELRGLVPEGKPNLEEPRRILSQFLERWSNDPAGAQADAGEELAHVPNLLCTDPVWRQHRTRVQRHPIGFMRYDFKPSFYADLPADEPGE